MEFKDEDFHRVKKPSEQGENEEQTQPTHGTGLESIRPMLEGRERSHHCAILEASRNWMNE